MRPGFVLDVGLYVRCYGGVNGLVDVTVEQSRRRRCSPSLRLGSISCRL